MRGARRVEAADWSTSRAGYDARARAACAGGACLVGLCGEQLCEQRQVLSAVKARRLDPHDRARRRKPHLARIRHA